MYSAFGHFYDVIEIRCNVHFQTEGNLYNFGERLGTKTSSFNMAVDFVRRYKYEELAKEKRALTEYIFVRFCA